MLQLSYRLVVVTLDESGNAVSRSHVSPYKVYSAMERGQAEADAAKVHLEANQRVEIEGFIDTSRYEEGWRKGLIF